MTRHAAGLCFTAALALLSAPATAGPGWLARRAPLPEDPLAACDPRAEAITSAPNPVDARAATVAWLDCVVALRTPLPDLRERLDGHLSANRFEGVRRQKNAIIDHFTDRAAMKEVPDSPANLQVWLDRAEHQALYHRASGDTPYADALNARAVRLQKLQALLEYLDA
jgi:hypothetical protein